jgi:hypothetical protein
MAARPWPLGTKFILACRYMRSSSKAGGCTGPELQNKGMRVLLAGFGKTNGRARILQPMAHD